MNELEMAKIELERYKDLLSKIWDDETTERDELIYLKFFKAGVEIGKSCI